MYRLRVILQNIYRKKRRSIVSCLLLTAVLSVVFCNFAHASIASRELTDIEYRYSRRHYLSFRHDLQYNPAHPTHSAGDIRLNGTSHTNGEPDIFFDNTVMQSYNHPYPVTVEMYHQLGISASCTAVHLAYAENAYITTSGELPEQVKSTLASYYGESAIPKKILTEHTVVGGSLDAFTGIARETSHTAYDFQLTEGAEPGANQCAITRFYATLYDKTLGDTVTLQDFHGNALVELTISGIYDLYEIRNFEYAVPEIEGGGRSVDGTSLDDYGGIPDVGTPYDRLGENLDAQIFLHENYSDCFRVTNAMLAVIHTDFETAYTLSTEPHFNNFFACYDLMSPNELTDFSEQISLIFPDDFADELTVYPFTNTLEELLRQPMVLAETAQSFLRLTVPLSIFILLIVSAYTLRENSREDGIYLSLGISEGDICLKNTAENIVLLLFSGITASIAGNFVYCLLSRNYIYLEILPTGYHLSTDTFLCFFGFFLFCTLFSLIVSILSVLRKTPAAHLRGL